MAGLDKTAAGCGRPEQGDLQSPPAGPQSQDAPPSFTPLDSRGDETVQPFPRSPNLLRRLAKPSAPTREQLSTHLQQLQAERSRAEAHLQSLKKRRSDLSASTEAMKQQVRERFDAMRAILQQEEQAAVDSLEVDLRQTRTRLDHVLKNWEQHLSQVSRGIGATQRVLTAETPEEPGKLQEEHLRRPDISDESIQLDKDRFQRLLKILRRVSRDLTVQLQRRSLLLDSSCVRFDRQTCHAQLAVTSEGRGLSFLSSAHSGPEHPLQFDAVCCALASSPVTAGRSYWEVDVRCCSRWAVGVAYGSLRRKGRDKQAKLGRNRNSWCVELRHGRVSAWHNDRHVACQGTGQATPGRVGVWADYERGQLMFYDADTMGLLQRFSAAVTPVFDRAHHQFTEPLYPAVRFLKPAEGQAWPNHLTVCSGDAL